MGSGAKPKTRLVGWITVFGLGSALIGGIAGYGLFQQRAYQHQAEHEATDYAKHAAAQGKQSCIRLAAPEKAQCLIDAQAEYNLKTSDKRREYADLVAQRKSALWTFIMGLAALIGMALSAIGVILIKQTFDETKRTNRIAMKDNARATLRAIASAKDTKTALAIAADQVEVSRETAAKQLRAYVGVQAINYTYNMETRAFDTIAEVMNFGQTPASQFRSTASLTFCYLPISQLPEVDLPVGNTHNFFPTMRTYMANVWAATDERIAAVRNGTGCFFLTVIIEYRDYTGERHLERIRYYVTSNLNQATFHSTHTGTMTFHSGEGD